MKNDKAKAVAIIVEATQKYKEYLQNKVFLIIFQDGSKVNYVQVEFKANHFLHLSGVKTKLSAKHFYEKCLNRRLSINDFEFDDKGKTQQKLDVLPYLHELLYNNCMIGNFINSGIYIRADYFVGNTKAVLSVGFRNKGSIDIPVSLYKEDVRKLSHPTNKVLAIFVKDSDKEKYSKCTYLSKGQEISKLHVPEEIKNAIQDV